jgi:TetR/AcrR family transcriptional regulator, cholesterol catabolism regulator
MVAPAKPRRTVDRRNREVEVLDAAVKVFFVKGYKSATIQDVADIVGVLKGSLYHYITSKEDLLYRIFEGSHEQALEIMKQVEERGLPPREHLREYLTEMISWYLKNIERVSLYFNEWHYLTGENAETVRKQRRVFSEYLRDILVAGDADLRPGSDVKLLTFYILGAINNMPVWYRRSGDLSVARLASEFASISCSVAFVDE